MESTRLDEYLEGLDDLFFAVRHEDFVSLCDSQVEQAESMRKQGEVESAAGILLAATMTYIHAHSVSAGTVFILEKEEPGSADLAELKEALEVSLTKAPSYMPEEFQGMLTRLVGPLEPFMAEWEAFWVSVAEEDDDEDETPETVVH